MENKTECEQCKKTFVSENALMQHTNEKTFDICQEPPSEMGGMYEVVETTYTVSQVNNM